jgi:hypothetical protein
MKQTGILFSILLFLLFCFCKKQPGPGGQASIKGKITVKKYNKTFTTLISTYDGSDVYIYLAYGDNVSYDKRIKTSYDGSFEFLYLQPGKYKFYTYSKDSTLQSPSGNISIVKEVHVDGRKETVDIGNIYICQ